MFQRLTGTVLLMLAAAIPATAQTYSIIDLGPCTPEAMNASGQVTGHKRFSTAHVADHAFRWSPASPNTFVDLGLPKGYTSAVGWAINSNGDVAGTASSPTAPTIGNHALLWPTGAAAQLVGSTKSSDLTSAAGINDAKDIVGSAAGGAFLSKVVNGKRTLYIIGPGAARAVNASGKVLGHYQSTGYLWTPSGAPGKGTSVSFPAGYAASALTNLGALAGSRPHPTVAPWGPYDSNWPVVFLPGGIVGSAGSWLDIPWPAAVPDYVWNWGQATGINSGGVVVGISAATGPNEADLNATWIWDSLNGTRTLDSLIPAGTGWTLFNLNGGPTTINDNGWIMGTGTLNGEKRGFVLIPN
jgi:hypothetical protein